MIKKMEVTNDHKRRKMLMAITPDPDQDGVDLRVPAGHPPLHGEFGLQLF